MATIRPDHPRLWVNSDTLPALKARAVPTNDRFATLKAAADVAADWNTGIINYALMYLLTGNGLYASRAFELMSQSMAAGLNQITPDSGYQARNYLPAAAICYDWLNGWLNAQQKQQLRADIEVCADWVWPETNAARKGQWAVTDPENNYFGGFLLTWMAGLSLFGDSPKAQSYLDNARSKWNALVVPALTGDCAGGVTPEGTGYGTVTIMEYLQSVLANLTATGEDLIASTPFFGQAMSALIHLTNPAQTEIAPFGDLGAGPVSDRHRIVALMLAAHDPRCKQWLDSIALQRCSQRLNAAMEFLFYPATALPFPTEEEGDERL